MSPIQMVVNAMKAEGRTDDEIAKAVDALIEDANHLEWRRISNECRA